MATFTVSGLSSGIDYKSLIDELVSLYKERYITPLEDKQNLYTQKLSAYDELSTKLDALESAVNTLRTASGFDVKTASVDDSTVLSATASSSAINGTYTISDITSLAQAHKITNVNEKSLPDKDTTIVLSAGQTFKFTVNGTTTTITASSDLTLEGLVSEINNANGGVTATIINDGSATNPYRLVLTSDTTGTSGAITIDLDESVLDLDNTSGTGGVTTLQAAQDAAFKVDGLSITKSSNTVSDVIPGVTFTLKKATGLGNSYTLTVSNDIDTIQSNIEAFIDAYNEVVNYINENSDYDTQTHQGEPLFNEPTVQSVMRRLHTIITSGISGLSSDTKILAQIGVSTNRDGTLSLDIATLRDKLTSDYNDVKALFIYDPDTGIKGVAKRLYDEVSDITDFASGAVTIRKEGIRETIDKYGEEIIKAEANLEEYEQDLIKRFAALESLISTLNSQSAYLTSLGSTGGA